MLAGDPEAEVREDLDTLVTMLREDAAVLDGEDASPFGTFAKSLLIIVREGVEAMLVVAAIVAYLVKSGNRDKVRTVSWGALLALGASVLLAIALNVLTGLTGANQEIIEGVTILAAVVMLVWVSSWVLSKSSNEAWDRYVEERTSSSLRRGSVLALAFVAFLAVFREGAETILFYQALLADDTAPRGPIWLGVGVGVLLLVVVYLLVRYLSIRIPLRPFFLATSVLLAVMAFSFVGSGVKELQEGGVVSVTPVAGVPAVDLLGVYPTVETLAAQGLVLTVLVVLFALELRNSRRTRTTPATPVEEIAR
jgi:high-affinity iron transporter